VWATITRHSLLSAGDRVLVAVSGGADSVALLLVLAALAPRAGAQLAGVVHVHHGLRGADADADAAFCEQLAASLGLPFDLVPVDVSGEAARRRWSVERTAHVLRHAAFRRVARSRMATRIALGHTLDDQAETVLLRFLRGAGTRGMSGMWPTHGLLVRPLLDVRRDEVERFVTSKGLTWRNDDSNRDATVPRNRVRHEILPVLMAMAGASLPERLARQADAWRDDEQWLAACAAVELPSVLTPAADGGWSIDLPRLADVPPMLQRRVRMAALEQMVAHGRVTSRLVEGLARLERIRQGESGRLGPLQVSRQGARLRVVLARPGYPRPWAQPGGAPALPERYWTVPGEVRVDELGLSLVASVLRRSHGQAIALSDALGTWEVALDADVVGARLLVRGRRPGDRMRPVGVSGSQKIQDVMVNRKVPRLQRDRVPVVTTESGRIAWVVGLAVGEEFAVQPHTTAVLLLQATRSGGKA
jgi:tRNA(Ile)-lysidine synthase